MFDEVGRHPGICTATSREQLAAEEALILKQCGLACSTMCGLWRYETYQLPSWGPATCCSAWRRWGFAAPTCTFTKARPTTTWTREDSLCLSLVTRRFSATRFQGRSLQWAQRSVICANAAARGGGGALRHRPAQALLAVSLSSSPSQLLMQVPKPEQPVNAETFAFRLRRDKLRQAFRREGHYLLRSNLPEEDPARLWQHYVQLTEIEAVFRTLKSDLAIRPIHHQKDSRIEAHIFVSFLAYCLYVTLRQRLRTLAPGLTPRAVLEKMSAIQMVDVRVPTTDGRLLILPRYTQPEKDHQMLLHELHLQLPAQPPPRILQ